ncbi:hypothetical protein [Erwinia sp. HR93]|uniref:structural cement protein Gp24 n=1 Tax=Erwinia sp. HR93 TaxID=3094840 RepID=UPI002ADEED4D|nr:hypothetical protein [Erwinia sp. HR93]MEA1064739.1 hypothetical protein [Erwinia sp. HR93]
MITEFNDGSVKMFAGMVLKAGGQYNDGMLMDETIEPGTVVGTVPDDSAGGYNGRSAQELSDQTPIAGIVTADARSGMRKYRQFGPVPVLRDGFICVVAQTDVTAGDLVGYDATGKIGAADGETGSGGGSSGSYFALGPNCIFLDDAAAGEEVPIRILL